MDQRNGVGWHWGPDGKLYSASDDCTIRVWSDDGATIFKTIRSVCRSMAWVGGSLLAHVSAEIWVWSSDELGPTDPPSHVLGHDFVEDVVGGPSGDAYAKIYSVIVKL
jgi:WD40 repeat protein